MTNDRANRREEWLAKRREVVTASDVAAILGEDPRRGPLAIYAQKVGGFETEENLPMRRGRRFEAAIAEEYQEQTGRPVLAVPEYELSYHPDIPWLAATLDRKVLATKEAPDPRGGVDVLFDPREVARPDWSTTNDRARAPLQIKMALGSAGQWTDEPPLAYVVQVTIEMACAGSDWGALCGMVGLGPLKVFDFPRNDGFLNAVYPKLEEFMQRVRDRRPPDPDARPETTKAIRKLWADEDGETIPLDREALQLSTELELAKRKKHKDDSRAQELDNRLRALMGNASFGALPDGSFICRRTVVREGYTVPPTKYVTVRRWWPEIRRKG